MRYALIVFLAFEMLELGLIIGRGAFGYTQPERVGKASDIVFGFIMAAFLTAAIVWLGKQ